MAISTGAAILGGSLLSGALGAVNARKQNKAAAAAARPQPYERHEVREPWAPTQGALRDLVELAREHYDRNVAHRPPPRISTSGIRGASPALRELANAMRERAMTSTFIPDAQAGLGEFLKGPNPMMQATFDRAMSYRNPMLEMLMQQGLSGPGSFDSSRPQMQGFIGNLLAGQQRLGLPPPPLQAALPPAVAQPPPTTAAGHLPMPQPTLR